MTDPPDAPVFVSDKGAQTFFLNRNHFFSLRFCSFTDGFEIGVGSRVGEGSIELNVKLLVLNTAQEFSGQCLPTKKLTRMILYFNSPHKEARDGAHVAKDRDDEGVGQVGGGLATTYR